MTDRTSGIIDLRATLLEPLHHGAGSAGNTARLRTDEIVLPDGSRAWVPFLSGNSLKHQIREHGVLYALETMGIPRHSLSQQVVHLLFSGGHLNKTGAALKVGLARRVAELFPVLSLCGYSAGNWMQDGKLRVSKLHLVCAENAWRSPDDLHDAPQAGRPAGEFRGDEMGTRMEPTGRHAVREWLRRDDAQARDGRADRLFDAPEPEPADDDTAQMIYEHEVILPGARLWGQIEYRSVTPLEAAALRSALDHACLGEHADGARLYRFGARSSIGWGLCSVHLRGSVRQPIVPVLARNESEADLAPYAEHLVARREEILSTLADLVA